MFIHSKLTQHVSGIIMPIVRRTDSIKLRLVLACMCWLRLCGVGTRAKRTVWMQVLPAFRQCAQRLWHLPIITTQRTALNVTATTHCFD